MYTYPTMTAEEMDAEARRSIAGVSATELADALSHFRQTWPYLAGIIDHVAEEGSSMSAQEFARSLQEESHK